MAMFENLNLSQDWDLVSADFDDQSSVYSISEGEAELTSLNAALHTKSIFMAQDDADIEPQRNSCEDEAPSQEDPSPPRNRKTQPIPPPASQPAPPPQIVSPPPGWPHIINGRWRGQRVGRRAGEERGAEAIYMMHTGPLDNEFIPDYHPGTPDDVQHAISMAGSWLPTKELPAASKECTHEWMENVITNLTVCYFCGILTKDTSRVHCQKCKLTTCALCAQNHLKRQFKGKKVETSPSSPVVKDNPPAKMEGTATELLLGLLQKKDEELARRIELSIKQQCDLAEVNRRMQQELSNKDKKIKELEEKLAQYETRQAEPMAEPQHSGKIVMEGEIIMEGEVVKGEEIVFNTTKQEPPPKIRKIRNSLYNFSVEFNIPDCPFFKAHAILDTGATSCFIDSKKVPKEALETISGSINIYGLNSIKTTKEKLKSGYLSIGDNKF